MEPRIVPVDESAEFATEERCRILEWWNDPSDPAVSVARARVAPGVTTAWHRVSVDERYVVLAGRGAMHLGDRPGTTVGPGDVVVIPAGVPQRIANTGTVDLVFVCVCTPRFRPEVYEALPEPSA
jgi:mannose-6-phosphate isomerase-like protein (cupin superfamily)